MHTQTQANVIHLSPRPPTNQPKSEEHTVHFSNHKCNKNMMIIWQQIFIIFSVKYMEMHTKCEYNGNDGAAAEHRQRFIFL